MEIGKVERFGTTPVSRQSLGEDSADPVQTIWTLDDPRGCSTNLPIYVVRLLVHFSVCVPAAPEPW